MNFPFNKMENNSLFTLNKINILKQKGNFLKSHSMGILLILVPPFITCTCIYFLGLQVLKVV